jgi:hypothetical protein
VCSNLFAPQVWKLFPRGQTIHLSFWDYNDVAPGYFAAAEIFAGVQRFATERAQRIARQRELMARL